MKDLRQGSLNNIFKLTGLAPQQSKSSSNRPSVYLFLLNIMCYTDNSAVHTTVFLNAQLSSLWENSAACAKKLDLSRQTIANRTLHSLFIAALAYDTIQATPLRWQNIRLALGCPRTLYLFLTILMRRSISRPCDLYATITLYCVSP